MNRLEEVAHFRNGFRRLDTPGKLNLVTHLRDRAIEFLQPVISRVQRDFSENIKAAYRAKGISLEWRLDTLEAYSFYFMAQDVGLTPGQQSAATLLYVCTNALEENAVSEWAVQNILDAYAGLDLDAITKAKKFTGQSRGPDALGTVLLEILKQQGKKTSSSAVWGELRGMAALTDNGIIQKITGDYVFWRNAKGSAKKTSAATVDNRLSKIRQLI